MPPDPERFLGDQSRSEWAGAYAGDRHDVVSRTACSWLLSRHGEVVCWGEGTVSVDFASMRGHDHDPSGYVLELGAATMPAASLPAVALVTPDENLVGYYSGEVAVKAHPGVSPAVRPLDIHEAHDHAEVVPDE